MSKRKKRWSWPGSSTKAFQRMLLNPFQTKPHPFLALLYSPGPQSKQLSHLFRTFWELIPSITFSEYRCLSPQWCSLHLPEESSPHFALLDTDPRDSKMLGKPAATEPRAQPTSPSRVFSLFPNVACVLSILSALPLPKIITFTLSHNLSVPLPGCSFLSQPHLDNAPVISSPLGASGCSSECYFFPQILTWILGQENKGSTSEGTIRR